MVVRVWVVLACWSGVGLEAALGGRVEDRPNFLLILTDDQGYGDVGVYGGKGVRTPHMDSLARDGVLFSGMRANCTVCSPSRAALLTGRYPERVGVPGVIRSDARDSWGYFSPGARTLPGLLREQGYSTALVGKWHLGLESPNTPNERGFDFFHGFLADMMDSYTTHRRFGTNYMRRDGEVIDPRGHATDLFTDWAASYLRNRRGAGGKPFFLMLAYNAPHFPIEPPAAYLERVRQREPGLDPVRAANVAMVEHLDDGIGRVLQALEESGLARNTVVVFTSDNGGSLPHGQSNDPWRGGKQSHYEGGLRVPFVVRWPAGVVAGSRTAHEGLVFDLFPTFLELAGVGGWGGRGVDAVSLVPILEGRAVRGGRVMHFVRREGGARYRGLAYRAVIRGGWKLLQNGPEEPWELYDLSKDPGERVDLAVAEAGVKERLLRLIRREERRNAAVGWRGGDP